MRLAGGAAGDPRGVHRQSQGGVQREHDPGAPIDTTPVWERAMVADDPEPIGRHLGP
jgi:hypothetical protein